MGCGRSAYDDGIWEEIFSRKIEKVKEQAPTELVFRLDTIKDLVERINKETNSGSRYLFSLLDDLVKATNWEKWE